MLRKTSALLQRFSDASLTGGLGGLGGLNPGGGSKPADQTDRYSETTGGLSPDMGELRQMFRQSMEDPETVLRVRQRREELKAEKYRGGRKKKKKKKKQ